MLPLFILMPAHGRIEIDEYNSCDDEGDANEAD